MVDQPARLEASGQPRAPRLDGWAESWEAPWRSARRPALTADARSSFPASMSFQPRDAFVVVPGFAAIGLALLYGTGAVIKSGQLRGADQNVRDTLPLVPLEQVLALGIGTVITSLVWVTVLSLGFTFWSAGDVR
jgi:hypothetical protein